MNLEDVSSGFEVRQRKFDFTVKPTGSKDSRVESVGSVGRHKNLDVAPRLESVQLVDDFEHGTLHFIVATWVDSEATRLGYLWAKLKHVWGCLALKTNEMLTAFDRPRAPDVRSTLCVQQPVRPV